LHNVEAHATAGDGRNGLACTEAGQEKEFQKLVVGEAGGSFRSNQVTVKDALAQLIAMDPATVIADSDD
jgi:hypothetical protein